MSSMHIDEFHNHGLHVVIPPHTQASENVSSGTPGHTHNLFVIPARRRGTPGHTHNLFHWPPATTAATDEATTPTTPKASARTSRRSSIFSVAHEPEAKFSRLNAEDALPANTHVGLLPTSETEEPDSQELQDSLEEQESKDRSDTDDHTVEDGN